MDESPRRRRTPAPRPETPTPQPGAVERARMNSCQSRRETWNDLQDSPRRQHPCNTENASHALSPPEHKASARSVFLGNKVCIINFFCATEVSSYCLFRPPLLLFRITYHYQALLQHKWSLAPIIKLSPHGNRCNYLKARDLRVSNVGSNRPIFNIKPCWRTKVSVILSLNCSSTQCNHFI